MLSLAFRFPGGRVHATPWGRHVNEGEVEWPPSPWRIGRALLATGYARAGWAPGHPPEEARRIVLALAGGTPEWWLPSGILGHTRHYLPLYKDATTKVIDAWVRVPRDRPAVGVWDVTLSTQEGALLDDLLARLGWLGRAESWVEAKRVDAPPDGKDYHRCAWAGGPATEGAEAVHGYQLMESSTYQSWRAEAIEAHQHRQLEERRATALRKGKAPKPALSKAERERVIAGYPSDPLEALGVQTTDLRKSGWSDPPGSVRVTCWRPPEALAPQRRSVPRQSAGPRPTFALLAVTPDTEASPTLTRLKSGVLRTQALHKTLVSRAEVAEFTGAGAHGHQHAHLLPLALGWTGRRERIPFAGIDHVLVWAPGGLGHDAQRALNRELAIFDRRLPRQFLSCVGFSADASGVADSCPVARRSPVWISRTPYVAPRHLKRSGRSSLVGQIREGLVSRSYPEPDCIEVEGPNGVWQPAEDWWDRRGTDEGRPAAWLRHYRLERREGSRPPQRVLLAIRVTFPEAVEGPLCLGFGSHYGLGMFYPHPTS